MQLVGEPSFKQTAAEILKQEVQAVNRSDSAILCRYLSNSRQQTQGVSSTQESAEVVINFLLQEEEDG